MADPSEIAAARQLLEAKGFVVLRAKSYRQAQERQRIAEVRRADEEEYRKGAESWARDHLAEERRLAARITHVYGVARAHGATELELAGPDYSDMPPEILATYRDRAAAEEARRG